MHGCAGFSALYFEIALDAVLEEIIGIDASTKQPSGKPGHFGKVKAALVTVEEQGRKSLHAHILLWVEEVQKEMDSIQNFAENSPYEIHVEHLRKQFDSITSTKLMGGLRK